MDIFQKQSNCRYHVTSLERQYSLILGISTRQGGFSNGHYASLNAGLHVGDNEAQVIKNRNKILTECGQTLNQCVFAEQVHGNKVKVVTEEDQGKGAYTLSDHIPGVDGLVTMKKGIVLAGFYADCVPLYFFDAVKGIIGIAHAGWQGTAKCIGKTMLDTFISLGSSVKDIHVVIGPAIEKAAYQVNQAVVDQMPVHLKSEAITAISDEQFLLDLKKVNQDYLKTLGVLNKHIYVSSIGTYSHLDFYSYRADQKTGRMMGYIMQ